MGSVLPFPSADAADAAVGARLRRWREARGMSLEDLAAQMGLSPEDERLAEAGRVHLDSLQIGAAIRALHLPIWALQSDSHAY